MSVVRDACEPVQCIVGEGPDNPIRIRRADSVAMRIVYKRRSISGWILDRDEPIVEVGTTNTGVGGVAATFQGSASSEPGPDGCADAVPVRLEPAAGDR